MSDVEMLEAGSVLAETYELIEQIGAGGMGVVWRAQHLRLPKEVAVKVLLRAVSGEEMVARFRREAEIIARVRHPNIVEVLDFNTLPDNSPYMVLELLSGQTLADRMRGAALSFDEVTAIVQQACAGLQVAHRQGVVHRDLKPENIFLCEVEDHDTDEPSGPQVKILDFGISKLAGGDEAHRLTGEQMVAGTPLYMAPEQARGKLKAADARSDQYSMAAMIFELLSGQPPFEADTLAALMFKVVYDDPPALPAALGLPDNVTAAVARGLCKTPDERFESVAAFCREFLRHTRSMQAISGRPRVRRAPTAPRRLVGSAAISSLGEARTVAADSAPPAVTGPPEHPASAVGTAPPNASAGALSETQAQRLSLTTDRLQPVRKRRAALPLLLLLLLLGGGAAAFIALRGPSGPTSPRGVSAGSGATSSGAGAVESAAAPGPSGVGGAGAVGDGGAPATDTLRPASRSEDRGTRVATKRTPPRSDQARRDDDRGSGKQRAKRARSGRQGKRGKHGSATKPGREPGAVAAGAGDPATGAKKTGAAGDPVAAKSGTAEPQPGTKKPLAAQPKPGVEPVAGKPVAGKPVAGKPVAGKPVGKKPVAKKPVAKKPVAKKPKPAVTKKPKPKKKPPVVPVGF
jgi:serine/threonine protein kinase